jgi:hypothetical protein
MFPISPSSEMGHALERGVLDAPYACGTDPDIRKARCKEARTFQEECIFNPVEVMMTPWQPKIGEAQRKRANT